MPFNEYEQALKTQKTHCPYCGERIELVVDLSAGEYQQYIEDCFVCCRPIMLMISVDVDTGALSIYAATENE